MLKRIAVLVSAVAMLATVPALRAQTHTAADKFTFVAGTQGERFDLVVNRWSTDAERDKVGNLAQTMPATVLTALGDAGIVGYVHLPGGLDYTLRYARRVERPNGTTEVVALADAPVWIWWDEGLKDRKATYPFTAIQFRITKDGVGAGKLSAWSVVGEKDAGIALGDYDKEPTLLTSVRRNTAS